MLFINVIELLFEIDQNFDIFNFIVKSAKKPTIDTISNHIHYNNIITMVYHEFRS